VQVRKCTHVGSLTLTCAQNLCRFRNLEYLENELQAFYLEEQEKMEAQERRLKKMQQRLA